MTSAHLHTPSALNHPRWGVLITEFAPTLGDLSHHQWQNCSPIDSADTLSTLHRDDNVWHSLVILTIETCLFGQPQTQSNDLVQYRRTKCVALDQIVCRPTGSWVLLLFPAVGLGKWIYGQAIARNEQQTFPEKWFLWKYMIKVNWGYFWLIAILPIIFIMLMFFGVAVGGLVNLDSQNLDAFSGMGLVSVSRPELYGHDKRSS